MRVIPVSQYQGGMLLIWTRLSGRPALKRAYWSFFLWADGRWPAHLRPHLFLCRQLQGALLVSHWSLAVPHFNSQPLTLPTSGRGSGSKSRQSCLWCLCVVEKQGGARDNLTRRGLRDLSLTFSLVASSGAVSHEVLCICAKDYSILGELHL